MLLTIGYHQLEGKRMELKKPFAVLDRVAGQGQQQQQGEEGQLDEERGAEYKVRAAVCLLQFWDASCGHASTLLLGHLFGSAALLWEPRRVHPCQRLGPRHHALPARCRPAASMPAGGWRGAGEDLVQGAAARPHHQARGPEVSAALHAQRLPQLRTNE